MKPGELRRFDDNLDPITPSKLSGCTFMILKIDRQMVDILIRGEVDPGWGSSWIEDNSEVISEAG